MKSSPRQLFSRGLLTAAMLSPLSGLAQAGALAQPGAPAQPGVAAPAPVNAERIENVEGEAANWLSYGRTYSEQRYSPLKLINATNAGQLRLAWYADLDTQRGQEATPLIVDGRLYVSTAWSMVKAYDAATGKPLWSYDPKVARRLGVNGCCDVVNRGVAAWNGKVFVGAFDGRLIALDANTGKEVWSTQTVDTTKPYTITQAPRVVKGRVLIGNSGGEYGPRGYISAYDAETGKLDWRFYTVPGDPSKPFENEAMARAAKTWSGEWWKLGGGGPVWDSISYDPELNLVYFGTGNGSTWSQKERSENRGDNLFLSSIVALNADTGAYVWHYQATPGEEWDYDAVQQLVLADLPISGRVRHVIMQANKNGFYYELDRKTGALLSAKAIVPQNWAEGIDMKTGRPIEKKGIRYSETGKSTMMPAPLGAHTWHAMSYNPTTHIAYIPTQQISSSFVQAKDYQFSPLGWNLGVSVGPGNTKSLGFLLAWDAARQREVWRVNYAGPWNGGTATTAGNIVAQGDAAGDFAVYRADNGKRLFQANVQSAIIAPPAVFAVGGEEYIAVLSGWGGAFALSGGPDAADSGNIHNISRVLVYKLGGTARLPPLPQPIDLVIPRRPEPADTASVERGEALFNQYCTVCHGGGVVGGGITPDLRASAYIGTEEMYNVVLNGLLQDNGMASFKSVLTRDDVTAIGNYVTHVANQSVTTVAHKAT